MSQGMNAWYAIAQSADVESEPLRRVLFGKPLVLFRTSDGAVAALADMCPHRNAPLSLGTVIEDQIQCRYHGFRFSSLGRCMFIPGQKGVLPSTVTIPNYPVLEKHGIIWVWPGEPELALPSKVIDWPYSSDPAFRTAYAEGIIDAPALMIIENLMDLTHIHFTHSFGRNMPVHASSMKVSLDNSRVRYTRDVPNLQFPEDQGAAPQDDTYTEIGGLFWSPAVILNTAYTKRHGNPEPVPGAPQRFNLHMITPESDERIRYIVMRSWNIFHTERDIAEAPLNLLAALQEDKVIIEDTYQNKKVFGDQAQEALIENDKAAVLAKRQLEAAFSGGDSGPERLRRTLLSIGPDT